MKIDTRTNSEEMTNSIDIEMQSVRKNFKAVDEDKFYSLKAKKLFRTLTFFETTSEF